MGCISLVYVFTSEMETGIKKPLSLWLFSLSIYYV
ncbi:hypothetical protein PT2222_140272 [Paraburkholderia tropica]